MYDVKDILAAALDRGPGPGQPVNPAGDLARGRRLLRRRWLTGLAGAAGVAAGITAVVLTLGPAGPAATHPGPAAGQHTRHHEVPAAPGHHPAKRAIKLVSYQGYQAPGYQVSEVPRGWVVQGSNAFALTVAPADDPDKSVDSFVGKIAVMLKSRDEPAPRASPTCRWPAVPVSSTGRGTPGSCSTRTRPACGWTSSSRPSWAGTPRSSPGSPRASRSWATPSPAAADRRPPAVARRPGRPGQPASGTGTESSSSRSRE